jgi:hypothetical protein
MPKFSILAVLLLAACSADTRDLERKVDALSTRINVLEARVGSGAPRAQRPRRPEPDPKDVYAVSIDGLPSKGPADAPVTIVEGYEYACPACKNARTAIAQLKEKYGDKLRIVYKQYLVHPEVATNGLSLERRLAAMSYWTATPSMRRRVVSDVIATFPCAMTGAPAMRKVPVGAVRLPSGLPNGVVNCARNPWNSKRVAASNDITVSPLIWPRRRPSNTRTELAPYIT